MVVCIAFNLGRLNLSAAVPLCDTSWSSSLRLGLPSWISKYCLYSAAAEEAEFAAEHPHTAITAINLEPTLEDILEEGVKRLQEKGTWKLWQWPRDGRKFYEADSFRQILLTLLTAWNQEEV